MDEDRSERQHGLVDAQQFLRVSDGLKQAFVDLGAAELPAAARERWQRRLLAITNLAKHDLDRAERQFLRFREDFDRELGEGTAFEVGPEALGGAAGGEPDG